MKKADKHTNAQKGPNRAPALPKSVVELSEQDLKQVQGGVGPVDGFTAPSKGFPVVR